jgi:predicted RND superfamily exporter protein
MEQPRDLREFRKSVWIYHSFPSLVAVVLLVLFLGSFFLTRSYALSAVTAAVPCLLFAVAMDSGGQTD